MILNIIEKKSGNDDSTIVAGVLGYIAERLKEKLFEDKKDFVDLVAGPDVYCNLPRLTSKAYAKKEILLSL